LRTYDLPGGVELDTVLSRTVEQRVSWLYCLQKDSHNLKIMIHMFLLRTVAYTVAGSAAQIYLSGAVVVGVVFFDSIAGARSVQLQKANASLG